MGSPRLGTFEQLLEQNAEVSPHVAEIARNLRRMIFEELPTVVEVVRLGDRAASYGLGPRKMTDTYVYLAPYRDHVNLGFFYGSTLPDPRGLLEGTGKRMRHSKVRTVQDAAAPGYRDLVDAALKERRHALGLSS